MGKILAGHPPPQGGGCNKPLPSYISYIANLCFNFLRSRKPYASTHIGNPNPRIKQIWLWCPLRTDQISPCSRSVPHFLEPDSGVGTICAGLTRILEPWEVPQSSNHYPTEHSEICQSIASHPEIYTPRWLLFENAPTGRLDPAVHGMGAPNGDCWRSNENRHSPSSTETQRDSHVRNACLSANSSTDPTMIQVRPPKFLHGNKRNGTIPQASFNAGSMAGGAIVQPFPHPTQ